MIISYIKKTIPSETEGLMNLEIETNSSHMTVYFIYVTNSL